MKELKEQYKEELNTVKPSDELIARTKLLMKEEMASQETTQKKSKIIDFHKKSARFVGLAAVILIVLGANGIFSGGKGPDAGQTMAAAENKQQQEQPDADQAEQRRRRVPQRKLRL